MSLLTKELEQVLPPLYSMENVKDPIVWARFFAPGRNWSWYLIEGSRRKEEEGIIVNGKEIYGDMIFFGLVDGFEQELGYFYLAELESMRTSSGYPIIKRDLSFKPVPLSKLRRLMRHSSSRLSNCYKVHG